MRVGYWVDLQNVKLDEGEDVAHWIQALPLGTYDHPLYGEIDVTPGRVARFASNVNSKIRDQELDIDYDHKQYSGKAAGWVTAAEARNDGLWLNVQWTPDAEAALKKGEYRYFSPELSDEWKHPKSGVVHKDVLFGGALTNRPFLKDILPINMSELADGGDNEVKEFLEKLRKALKLDETATEEEILQAAADAGVEVEPEPEEDPKKDPEKKEEPEAADDKQLSEAIENHPLIKKLLAENATLRTTAKLSEVNMQLTEWSSEPREGNRKFALPPAVHDDLRQVMLSENPKAVKALADVIDTILDTGLVELGERGGDRRSPTLQGHGGSVTKQLTEAVDGKMKAQQGLSYYDAVQQVMNEDPALYAAYREEVLTDTTGME